MRGDRINNMTFCVVAVAVTLLAALMWQLSTTMFSDDIVYRHMVTGDSSAFWSCGGPIITDFDMAWHGAVNHWTTVNGRLANIIYVLFQPIAPWVMKAINGILMAAMLAMMLAYGGGARLASRRWAVVMAVALMWTAFPWNDNMQSSDYQVNYTWTSVMVMAVMMAYRKASALSTGWFWGTVALAFFTGWMHEAFSLALLAWSGVMWLAERDSRRRRLIIIIALAAGTVMCVSSSTLGRLSGESEKIALSDVRYMVSRLIVWIWPVYLAMLMVAVSWLKAPRKQFRAIRPELLGLAAGAFVSFVIATVLIKSSRAYWPMLLMAVLAVLRCWSIIPCRGRSSRGSVAFSRLLLVLYAAWGVLLVCYQRTASRQQDDIYSLLAHSDQPTVYYDKIHNSDIPWLLCGIVDNDIDNTMFYNGMIGASIYTGDKTGQTPYVTILPKACEGLPFDQWPALPGNSGLRGCWPVLVGRDSVPDGLLQVTLGRPGVSVSPTKFLLMALREGGLPRHNVQKLKYAVRPTRHPDGSRLYLYFPEMMPRTARGREFKSVDIMR